MRSIIKLIVAFTLSCTTAYLASLYLSAVLAFLGTYLLCYWTLCLTAKPIDVLVDSAATRVGSLYYAMRSKIEERRFNQAQADAHYAAEAA